MAERNYYVLCDDNCKFPAMTKEQVIAAIAEATGNTPTGIDDAFITKLKEKNSGAAFSFWVGTQAEYNAIVAADEVIANCLYLLTDETTVDDMQKQIDDNTKANENGAARIEEKVKLSGITSDAETTITATFRRQGSICKVDYYFNLGTAKTGEAVILSNSVIPLKFLPQTTEKQYGTVCAFLDGTTGGEEATIQCTYIDSNGIACRAHESATGEHRGVIIYFV